MNHIAHAGSINYGSGQVPPLNNTTESALQNDGSRCSTPPRSQDSNFSSNRQVTGTEVNQPNHEIVPSDPFIQPLDDAASLDRWPFIPAYGAGSVAEAAGERRVLVLRGLPQDARHEMISDALEMNENAPKLVNLKPVGAGHWYLIFENEEDAKEASFILNSDIKSIANCKIKACFKHSMPLSAQKSPSDQYNSLFFSDSTPSSHVPSPIPFARRNQQRQCPQHSIPQQLQQQFQLNPSSHSDDFNQGQSQPRSQTPSEPQSVNSPQIVPLSSESPVSHPSLQQTIQTVPPNGQPAFLPAPSATIMINPAYLNSPFTDQNVQHQLLQVNNIQQQLLQHNTPPTISPQSMLFNNISSDILRNCSAAAQQLYSFTPGALNLPSVANHNQCPLSLASAINMAANQMQHNMPSHQHMLAAAPSNLKLPIGNFNNLFHNQQQSLINAAQSQFVSSIAAAAAASGQGLSPFIQQILNPQLQQMRLSTLPPRSFSAMNSDFSGGRHRTSSTQHSYNHHYLRHAHDHRNHVSLDLNADNSPLAYESSDNQIIGSRAVIPSRTYTRRPRQQTVIQDDSNTRSDANEMSGFDDNGISSNEFLESKVFTPSSSDMAAASSCSASTHYNQRYNNANYRQMDGSAVTYESLGQHGTQKRPYQRRNSNNQLGCNCNMTAGNSYSNNNNRASNRRYGATNRSSPCEMTSNRPYQSYARHQNFAASGPTQERPKRQFYEHSNHAHHPSSQDTRNHAFNERVRSVLDSYHDVQESTTPFYNDNSTGGSTRTLGVREQLSSDRPYSNKFPPRQASAGDHHQPNVNRLQSKRDLPLTTSSRSAADQSTSNTVKVMRNTNRRNNNQTQYRQPSNNNRTKDKRSTNVENDESKRTQPTKADGSSILNEVPVSEEQANEAVKTTRNYEWDDTVQAFAECCINFQRDNDDVQKSGESRQFLSDDTVCTLPSNEDGKQPNMTNSRDTANAVLASPSYADSLKKHWNYSKHASSVHYTSHEIDRGSVLSDNSPQRETLSSSDVSNRQSSRNQFLPLQQQQNPPTSPITNQKPDKKPN